MARGDAEFCRWETEFALDDARFVLLPPVAKAVYLHCWATAVRERRERPLSLRWPQMIAAAANIQPGDANGEVDASRNGQDAARIVERALSLLSQRPHKLLQARRYRDGHWSVKVTGVKSKHPKLRNWNDENGHETDTAK